MLTGGSGDVPLDVAKLEQVTKAVEDAGIRLAGRGASVEGEGDGESNGWDGGVVWLVPTDRPIAEWKPIAVREL